MRVFLVCADAGIPLAGTKGASVHLRAVTAALARRGVDVVAFAAAGANATSFPAPVLPLAALAGTGEHDPDVVYERYSLGHTEGLSVARTLGRPFVLEVNSPLVLEAERHRPRTLLSTHAAAEARLFREADRAVAVSEPLRAFVAQVRGTDAGTCVVRNGCHPELYPHPAPVGTRPGSTVAFLGHPKPWHGAELLVPLLARLAAKGQDARLLLIGGGPGARAVAAAAEEYGAADAVQVTGALPPESAAARLADADVAVAPYPPTPFFYFCPLKVIECMAAGLPVVTTAQGDLPALVGDAGVLVPPGDGRALAEAVGELLADQELRAELGGRARARALASFTWDFTAGALVDLFATARRSAA